jgi:hypothetical protein
VFCGGWTKNPWRLSLILNRGGFAVLLVFGDLGLMFEGAGLGGCCDCWLLVFKV